MARNTTAKRRIKCGYDDSVPEQCSNCAAYIREIKAKKAHGYFPPKCEDHEFSVVPHAVCNDWREKRDN